MAAAERLGIDVVVGSNRRQALEHLSDGHTTTIDFSDLEKGIGQIQNYHRDHPLCGILSVDEVTGILAATASEKLGLPHNQPEAVARTGNKWLLRQCLNENGLPQPPFQLVPITASPEATARRLNYPCVLKPLNLSASRGVIRANSEAEFVEAFARNRQILKTPDIDGRTSKTESILVEDFWPGDEVALEGIMIAGKLQSLALFDKPDPLDGPYFEETIYVTPSRLSAETQTAIMEMTKAALRAIGLREGAVHAELRLGENGPWVVEAASRSIGGLCARTLEFGAGLRLEDIILQHAVGRQIQSTTREETAAGVMMIPVPNSGFLRRVSGIQDAIRIPGIIDVTITIPIGREVIPLPESTQYLGFIFAKADHPDGVEKILREAHKILEFDIDASA
ncbi:MAG: ATP-grasp domain-containing protein [Proteobacteria bacterium]|nr:ATP-grasp domain-containing protein [Pseudomonadota bacterium]